MIASRYNNWMRRVYGANTAELLNAHHGVFKTLAYLIFQVPMVLFSYVFLTETAAHSLVLSAAAVFSISGLLALIAVLTGFPRLSDHIFMMSVAIVTMAMIYFTGGFQRSELAVFIVLLPMGVFQLYGTGPGFVATIGFASAIVLAYVANALLGVQPPNLFSDLDNVILKGGVLGMLYLSVLAVYIGEHLRATKLQALMGDETQKYADLASRDSLTHLANARGFNERLDGILEQFDAVGDEGFSIVFIDLNDFKVINDNHGHHVGDHVLQIVSKRIEKCIKTEDIASRLGGDEFAIILTHRVSDVELQKITNRLLLTIQKPIMYEHLKLSVTGSLGQVSCPEDGRTRDKLMKTADQRMYSNKRSYKGAQSLLPNKSAF
ncbi:MAG: GGDEF domain-containing protein [Pseudomonadota bacterium]